RARAARALRRRAGRARARGGRVSARDPARGARAHDRRLSRERAVGADARAAAGADPAAQGRAGFGRAHPLRSPLRENRRPGDLEMRGVPTIDLSRPGIAEEVARTCEETGFLIIANHGFPLELLERAKRQLYAFF